MLADNAELVKAVAYSARAKQHHAAEEVSDIRDALPGSHRTGNDKCRSGYVLYYIHPDTLHQGGDTGRPEQIAYRAGECQQEVRYSNAVVQYPPPSRESAKLNKTRAK